MAAIAPGPPGIATARERKWNCTQACVIANIPRYGHWSLSHVRYEIRMPSCFSSSPDTTMFGRWAVRMHMPLIIAP